MKLHLEKFFDQKDLWHSREKIQKTNFVQDSLRNHFAIDLIHGEVVS